MEIADIDPSTETEDIEESVRGFFDHGSELELKMCLNKRPFRGKRKASGGNSKRKSF